MTAICDIFSSKRILFSRPHWRRVKSLPYPAAEQLNAYFAGTLSEFDLPICPEGTTFPARSLGRS